ncbi:MAG: phosphatase domain-containing protein [Planctomycetota bacterium]
MADAEAERAPQRNGYAYPLWRRNDRPLAMDWTGPLYVFDIDNTYLLSEWTSFRDLLRLRFEAAEDKQPVPGAVELLSGLRRLQPDGERPAFYFVSASPNTMRGVLEKRMLIDGVLHDGITFRDLNRLRYLRDIFGYKLAALLLYRLENPRGVREFLFGDDREHDPLVYSLYTQVCSGALRGEALLAELETQGVRTKAQHYIVTLADELPAHDPVEWVFIRRLRPGEPSHVEREVELPPRLLFLDDYGEAAAVLRALDLLNARAFQEVLRAVRREGMGEHPLRLVEATADHLPPEGRQRVAEELAP